MRRIYENKDAAAKAAKNYQKENGGIVFVGITEDLSDEDTGRTIGTYGKIVVGTGVGSEPFGDTWVDFYYNIFKNKKNLKSSSYER